MIAFLTNCVVCAHFCHTTTDVMAVPKLPKHPDSPNTTPLADLRGRVLHSTKLFQRRVRSRGPKDTPSFPKVVS